MAELSSISYNSYAYVRMSLIMTTTWDQIVASMAELSSISYNSYAYVRMSLIMTTTWDQYMHLDAS